MTRGEKNRFIAEALGWTEVTDYNRGFPPNATQRLWEDIPDFYSSEEANALVLEAMRKADDMASSLALTALFDELRRTTVDRKTATCEAFLALKIQSSNR